MFNLIQKLQTKNPLAAKNLLKPESTVNPISQKLQLWNWIIPILLKLSHITSNYLFAYEHLKSDTPLRQ